MEEHRSEKVILEKKILELENINFKLEEARKKLHYELEILKEKFSDIQTKYEKVKIT